MARPLRDLSLRRTTLDETGFPGFHVTSWNELFGPRGLPNDIRKLLSDALVDVIRNDKTIP